MNSYEISAKLTEWSNSAIEWFSSLTFHDIGKVTLWTIVVVLVCGTYEWLQKYFNKRPELASGCHRVEDVVLRIAYIAMGIVATVLVFRNIPR